MSSGNPDWPYWLALARCLKLGPKGFAQLRAAFPTMLEAWQAGAAELKKAGLEPELVKALITHRQTTDVAASQAQMDKLGLGIITITSPSYPKLLKEIYDPPAVLFAKGEIDILQAPCLAVVGARQASVYGLNATKEIVSGLAAAGLTIVSGLAYGIDAAAHKATLEAGGKTIAVMASGLDEIYPAANRRLAEEILKRGGLWLSEFPPGTAPLKQNFPFRNRIIAGLARGTLVVEAAPGSGALLTAKHALEANREVFAVPGNITSPVSIGTNDLLKQGAQLVTSAADILTVFGLTAETKIQLEKLSDELQALLEKIPYEPTHIETLVRELNLSASKLMANLTLLELKGYIKDTGGQNFIRLN